MATVRQFLCPASLHACCLVLCWVLPEVAASEASPDDAATTAVVDGYVLHQQTSSYAVTGDDAGTVRLALDRLGPVGADGKHYGGYTKWNVHWEYVTQSDASGGCVLVSSSVVLTVDVTLPQWQQSINAPPALQQRWSTYLTALRTHENGHVQNAKREAVAIVQLLHTIGPQSDCDLLDQKLQDLGHDILQRYKDNDVDYDQRTGHGQMQGAVFP